MTILNQSQTNDLKLIVLQWLSGKKHLNFIKGTLQCIANDTGEDCKSLFKSLEISMDDTKTVAIISALDIKLPSQGGDPKLYQLVYNSANYYELLKTLYHNGFKNLGFLILAIHSIKPQKNWLYFLSFGMITTVILGGFFYFKQNYFNKIVDWCAKTFPTVIKFSKKILGLLSNVAIIGVIFKLIGLGFSWHNTITNATLSSSQKIFKLLFKAATSSLSIIGYILAFMAGVMTYPAAILFVVSEFAMWLPSIISLFKNKKPQPLPENANWATKVRYETDLIFYKHNLKAFFIKLGAALLTTIAVGIWLFSPPMLILAVFSLSFMALTSLMRIALLSKLEENTAYHLQEKIKNIKDSPFSQQILEPDAEHLDYRQNEIRKRKMLTLEQKEKQLNAKEKQLKVIEQFIDAARKDQSLSFFSQPPDNDSSIADSEHPSWRK